MSRGLALCTVVGNYRALLHMVRGIFPLDSLWFVVIPESREGEAAGPWHHHHIRPTFRHRNCKVRCNNPPNFRSNRIARSCVYQGGLQPRAYGPVRISTDSSSPTKPTQAVFLVDAFNSMQAGKRRCGSRPDSSSFIFYLLISAGVHAVVFRDPRRRRARVWRHPPPRAGLTE
jgi:hypothetical protein